MVRQRLQDRKTKSHDVRETVQTHSVGNGLRCVDPRDGTKRNLLERKEESFWNAKIASNAGNSKKLWSVLNSLQRKDRVIPPSTSDISADDKVRAVRDDTSTADEPTFTKLTDASFIAFQPGSTEEVRKFLIQSPPKSCSLNPLPTFILQEFLDELLPFICIMCNVSLQHDLLPESQKAAIYRHTNPQET